MKVKSESDFSGVTVLHVGIVGPFPGGMAQVVNGYLNWNFKRTKVSAVCSSSGKHDYWMAAKFIWCLLVLVRFRLNYSKRLVVVHLSERGSFVREGALVLVSRILGLSVVGHLHGANFVEFAQDYRWLVRHVLSMCNSVFVLTDETQSAVVNLGMHDVRLISNCVSIPDKEFTKEKILLFGGELSFRKGVDVLLEAWKIADRTDWKLVLAGPINSEIDRKTLCIDSVEFLGPVPHDRLLELQESAAIAILPSRDEALPMFLIESMARACAVISCDVGQIAALLDSGGGVICEPGSVSDLVVAIEELASIEVSSVIGMKAYETVKSRYDAATVLCNVEKEWVDLAC